MGGGHPPGRRTVHSHRARCDGSDRLGGTPIGAPIRLSARGRGDAAEGVEVSAVLAAHALVPPSPVHFRADVDSGGLTFRWTRRSRAGWQWLSNADTPLAEEREAYLLTLSGPGGSRAIMSDGPAYAYSAEAQADDALGRPIAASVQQLGQAGASAARSIIID